MQKSIVLVSGKNGQLGKALQDASALNENFKFIFFDKEQLNIADEVAVKNIFHQYAPAFFINCAAYTAVDKAETERQIAYKINAESVGIIAKHCYQFNTKLIHISTDYVFDGKAEKPYSETDTTNPVNYYGYTKLLSEQYALANNPETMVIRTSWVYSKYGNNFVKTMLRLMNERKEISVVNDQVGSPTYSRDLAETILLMAQSLKLKAKSLNGIYHFSNYGAISWYDFAVAINKIKQFDCIVNPIPTSAYLTPAKRPAYSVLDKSKIENTFSIQIKDWKESLEHCLQSF